MEFGAVSPKTYLLTEDIRTITFDKYWNEGEYKPKLEECMGIIKGVRLSYAFRGEQDVSIKPLLDALGVTDDYGLITKVPLETGEEDGARFIKYGRDSKLNDNTIQAAKKVGIIGYWDDPNLMICAAPEYDFVIDSISKMFTPKKVRLGFNRGAGNIRDLLILAV